MLDVEVTRDELHFGASVTLRFMRTLRVPDDRRQSMIPSGLGTFPIYRVRDYADRAPAGWRERGGVFIPMHRCEAMWIDFSGRWWKPNAVSIGIGGLNAISGEPWAEELSDDPQSYVVVPEQPDLVGIHIARRFHQFTAGPLEGGNATKRHPADRDEMACLRIIVFEPKPGLFSDEPPVDDEPPTGPESSSPPLRSEMAPGSGGSELAGIYPDEYGLGTWDLGNYGGIEIRLVDDRTFQEITAEVPPPTPVSAEAYAGAAR